jgi:hypothetical protein
MVYVWLRKTYRRAVRLACEVLTNKFLSGRSTLTGPAPGQGDAGRHLRHHRASALMIAGISPAAAASKGEKLEDERRNGYQQHGKIGEHQRSPPPEPLGR